MVYIWTVRTDFCLQGTPTLAFTDSVMGVNLSIFWSSKITTMGNQTAAGMHKKLYATIKIFLIGLTMCSFYFGCKKKDLFSNQVQVLQNAHFYQRDASLAYLFKDINGPRADNLFLNNILEGLRRSDPSNRLANAVTKKLVRSQFFYSAIFLV